jgi:two-component system chemotaxis response regulator CheB
MPKPDKNQVTQLRASRNLLAGKVVNAARSKVLRGSPRAARPPSPGPRPPEDTAALATQCIGIGISTGGPQTLTRLIAELAPPMPPILVVQHMPAQFTCVLAQRLDRLGDLRVKEAEDGELLQSDHVYIANGALHLEVAGRAPRVRALLVDSPPVSGHRPSVDVLFRSIARAYRDKTIGVIMTGMGRDGVDGCHQILASGGRTLGQDESTSIVYGMNRAAFEAGFVQSQFALAELAPLLRQLVRDAS